MKLIYFTCVALVSFSFFSAAKTVEVKSVKVIQTAQLVADCANEKWNKASLFTLKKNNFVLTDNETRDELALQLLNCLASPDPELRDGIAFEALSFWLREKQLSSTAHQEMFKVLMEAVSLQVNDEYGVYQPFAILVLAELARVDRLSPYFTKNKERF